jgi:hypothetical protein
VTADRLAVPVFVGWTLFVWVSRVRNVLTNDDLSTGDQTWRLAVVVVFVALAALTFWSWTSRAERPDRARSTLGVFCVWTVAFWIVRGGGIILDDHTLGFTIVHTVLMAVSIGLAGWAWSRQSDRAAVLNRAD